MLLHQIQGLIEQNQFTPEPVEGIYRVMDVYWDRKRRLGEGRILQLSDSSTELEVFLPGQKSTPWFKKK